MKAATVRRYGGPEVVRIEEVPTPVARPGELRVRVTAAAVTAADARLRANDAPRGFGFLMRCATGLRRPRRPISGMAFAGVVDALGPGVAGFTVGQRVFGSTGLRGGAHAEYLTIATDRRVFPLPDTLSDPEGAALCFGGLTATDFLMDKSGLRPGERLLINGATGAVGSAAIRIGRHLDAHITAVARVENHRFARTLGAHEAIDYRDGPLSGRWDVILDVVGTLPYASAAPLLAPGGRLLPVTATLGEQLSYALRRRRGGHVVTSGIVADDRAASQRLVRLHATLGYRPVIGELFPFAKIAEAHARAGARHNRGTLVVTLP